MRAMVLEQARQPLVERDLPDPEPAAGQVLIEVSACAVCRTDLHIFDGELTEPKLPLVLGHMIVGRVAGTGEGATRFAEGDRVGVPWLGWVDETCRYCRIGSREPLRGGQVHRLRLRRRLRGADRRRRALLLPDPGVLLGRARRSAALLGADRLPVATSRR